MSLTNVHPNLSCTYETSKERANFLNLNVSLKNGAISTDLYAKSTNGHNTSIISHLIQNIFKMRYRLA